MKKVKEWLNNKPQFEVLDTDKEFKHVPFKVRRIKDDFIFSISSIVIIVGDYNKLYRICTFSQDGVSVLLIDKDITHIGIEDIVKVEINSIQRLDPIETFNYEISKGVA